MSSLPYKIVATDLDGTLLNPQHRVSDYTKRVLDALILKGVFVVLATGRHHVDVLATKRKLGLKTYVITSNGARVHDPEDRLVFEYNIDPDITKELVMLAADDADIVTSFYSGDSWFMSKRAKDMTEVYEDNKDIFFYKVFNPLTAEFDHVYKVYYTSDNRESLTAVAEKLSMNFKGKVGFAFSLPNCLEVMPKDVNKGVVLKRVVEKFFENNKEDVVNEQQQSIRHCIAFGDGCNDIDMLKMAEKGCIMENALPELRSMAPSYLENIGNNAEDAVARYLANVFSLDV